MLAFPVETSTTNRILNVDTSEQFSMDSKINDAGQIFRLATSRAIGIELTLSRARIKDHKLIDDSLLTIILFK